jgi:hypothetical protein
METAIVIRGVVSEKQFFPNEPMPDVEGPAELIVYAKEAAKPILPGKSMFEFFGKAPQLRSAQDINAQIREEREAWGDR